LPWQAKEPHPERFIARQQPESNQKTSLSLENNYSFPVNGWPRNETSGTSRHDVAHASEVQAEQRAQIPGALSWLTTRFLPGWTSSSQKRDAEYASASLSLLGLPRDEQSARSDLFPRALFTLSGRVCQFARLDLLLFLAFAISTLSLGWRRGRCGRRDALRLAAAIVHCLILFHCCCLL